MEKKTLSGWIWDFAKWAFLFLGTVFVVRLLGGDDLIAGGLGAIVAIRFTEE